MTKEQCLNCHAPTKACRDPQFAHLMSASCLDYEPKQEQEVKT